MWFTHWLTDEQYSECSALSIACRDLRWLAPWPASTHHWVLPLSDQWATIEIPLSSHWAAIETSPSQFTGDDLNQESGMPFLPAVLLLALSSSNGSNPTLVDSCGFPSIPLWSPQWNSLLMNQCWFRSASCPIRWGTFSERNWIFEIPLHSDRLQI